MVVTSFSGIGVGFGFGVGCGFGIGWGFGGSSIQTLGLGIGGGCGVGVGLGWGFGAAYGSRYFDSKLKFEGIEFDQRKQRNKFEWLHFFKRVNERKKLEALEGQPNEAEDEGM